MHLRFTSFPVAVLVALTLAVDAFAAPSVKCPATSTIGASVSVQVSEPASERDFVTIVPKGTAEGNYEAYAYANKGGALTLLAPAAAGDYEIRLLGANSPYPTLARCALKLTATTATLKAPTQVDAGAPFKVEWTGPDHPRDYIGIGELKAGGSEYTTYKYTNTGSPMTFQAPDAPGDYELRYFLASGNTIIGRHRFSVGSVSATLTVPASVAAGAKISIAWKGPNNPRDFITIVKAGAAARSYEAYVFTSKGSPLQLTAPDEPGDYEVRYLAGQSYESLGTAKITVTGTTATVSAAAEAVAGTQIPVKWTGPGHARDYITIVAKGAPERSYDRYTFVSQGNPLQLRMPLEAGEYELRYLTGQSYATLARAPIRVTAAATKPGTIAVALKASQAGANGVEIILDASGSMLQRMAGQRRIDVAKQTLAKLTAEDIPAGTPFALRVFGREVDSCQTDLDIPLAPLDRAAVKAKLASIEAKNNAKTPIGASLEKVASDLGAVRGERLVILVTDGEETCDGDPAAAIEKLARSGTSVRVNIVGFAIDDAVLATTFRHWAQAGAGKYFDAKDAAALSAAMKLALKPAFELVDAKGEVVGEGLIGEAPVSAMPGDYTVRLKGQPKRAQPVKIVAGQKTDITL